MIEILQGYDRAPIVTLETDDASALESKLSAAARLFMDRKSWQEPFERIAILHRLSVLLEGKREHFGLQIAREGGKPLTDALIEVDRTIDGVRNAADMLRAGSQRNLGVITILFPGIFVRRIRAACQKSGKLTTERLGESPILNAAWGLRLS